ncbi:hypothetical protein Misp01_17980 [Microtetraspora sp. NBRC 13810]|uniref:effector-associated constant component EACC1 n=1 Tax=Microtetraspora sp. NBRC 13810 TaxID=3030990 RepID=UPI0024A22EA8|nr:hypothetical protein [Microtetraspora sp. NBRC 13810]GLW06668.1 hypothetical protein Misp01_17980 [Microtetraspora sp. NBRC 13810]
MTVVEFESADEGHLRALDDWLRGEEAFRGRVELDGHRPAEGWMGTPPRSLLVSLDADPGGAALARSLEVWFRLREEEVTLRVRVDGRVAEFTGRGEAAVEGFVREVETLLRHALNGG